MHDNIGGFIYELVDASEAPTGHLDIDSAMPVVESKKIEEKVFEVILLPKHPGLHDVIVKSNSSVIIEGTKKNSVA